MNTTEEWSNAFDVQIANYIYLAPFGQSTPLSFDEYEKSFYLTKALSIIVLELYNGKALLKSFEETEEIRRQLNYLVNTWHYHDSVKLNTGLEDKFIHSIYELPSECWYIIYEQALYIDDSDKCISNLVADVVPCTHDEYYRTINNPFRGPNKKRVLRLDSGMSRLELISLFPIKKYTIRYILKPEPIILCNLSESNLTIDNYSLLQTCLLPEILHPYILDRAVLLAVSNRINNINKNNASK